tara:strand:+ start:1329 stop:1766 length:438 start_codon:yes stop_codon:yes gene_type:complete
MNKKEILYLNDDHKKIVEGLMKDVKELMYYATEDQVSGKYQDFLNILDSVYLYSNNFHETTLKIEGDNGVMAEFIFLIPNMLFYTSIGFLTALKTSENNKYMKTYLEDIASFCENATSELADVLIDETEKKKLLEDIIEGETIKN